jgi:uncharacterized Ntn-hydrolase superfamily protein
VTFSIIARDPLSGDLGVAVQTRYLAVGATVPWARAGVGAVATQALTEASYGPSILDNLERGLPAAEALAVALELDPLRENRQVGLVDSRGDMAAHTGTSCIEHAEHHLGSGLVTMGNILEKSGTAEAMAIAFQETDGSLARRMLAALLAGRGHGGELRGEQSAAMVVVSTLSPNASPDLRVDDHPDPLGELERLLGLHEAYEHLGSGLNHYFASRADEAQAALAKALERYPDDPQIRFWNELIAGRPPTEMGRGWQELARRLRASHLRRGKDPDSDSR